MNRVTARPAGISASRDGNFDHFADMIEAISIHLGKITRSVNRRCKAAIRHPIIRPLIAA